MSYYGEYHSEIATTYKNLGITWTKIGNQEKSYQSFMKSAKINFKLYGEEHIETGMSYYNLEKYFWDKEEFYEVKKYFEKAHHIY